MIIIKIIHIKNKIKIQNLKILIGQTSTLCGCLFETVSYELCGLIV